MNKEFQTLRKKQRFGLRKLNIGVASVLLGFTIFGYNLASQAPVAHAATSTVATSAGSGSSGSSATGVANGSQASNSQATSATSSAATASQTTSATQVTAPAASQSSAPANSDNASSSTANQAGTVSANQTSNTSTAGAPASSDQTVTVDETTLPAPQAAMLLTNLAVVTNSGTDTTLPTTTQTYDKVEQPLLYDYLLHTATGTRDGKTWVDKTVAKGVWNYPRYTLDTIFGTTSKPGIITSHPDKYFFAAYVDYSEQYHRVILLARGQDPSDKNLYSYTIHTYSQNNSTTTTKPGESIKEQYTGTGGSTHDLIFHNYGDSFSVKLSGRLTDGYGLLPVFDEGLLDPTYGSNTLDQNDKAAQTESIAFWASAIPQKTSTKVRYVDQATGKDIVQPMEISGFGYQGFKVKGDAPTVTGYHLVSSPEFLPSTNKASAYEDGTISPYKVGQTYDLALSDSVVIKQTVIDTNGTVRATAYYNGSRLPSTDASKVLGRESYNDKMSFGAPDGKFYTYTNRIGQVDGSYIYYYAKDSDPDGSEMRLHFIDVTGVNNSSYAPSDGPELDVDKVQTIHGNIGKNYNFTYTVPKGYDQVATSDVTGTYSKTHHDAYVYVKANTPKPVTTPVKTNENTPLTDGQAKDAIANNSELPDGTTYTWSKQPDTTQPGDKTGEVTVHYPDGSSETVTVPVYVNSAADNNTPTAVKDPVKTNENTPLTDGQAKDAIANNSELPDGTTYTWSKQPDTTQPGDKTGEVTVHYPDGSSETVTVPVYVNSAADNNTPTAVKDPVKTNENTPLTDGQAKDAIANNSELPDGTTYTWSKQPDTTQPGDKTGEVTVHYPDGSSETVTVPVYVNSAADNNTPTAVKDPVKTNENTPLTDGQAKDAIANNSELPDGTTYTWSKQPDTTQPGDKTGEVTVHYPDGSSETVTVPVYVNSAADNNTPTAVKDPVKTNENTPLTDGQAKDAIANNSELPDGTTYTWSKQPDTTQPGDKTGEVTVHYPDGSSETVTVPVYVNSAADNNTPTAVKDPVKTNENTPLTDGQAKDAIANNSELPDGTTYTWSKQPDTTQPGDKTGEVTVHYPDGSSETVTVPVYVNSAADNNTPTAVKDPVKTNENTPLTDGQAKDAIANNSELPDGTTYTWSKQPDTTQPGDKTGEVTVHYPDGSSETVTVPVYVNSAADNNTPTAVKDPVKTNENTPLTDGQAKDAIANNSELPDGTTYTWSKQPDTTQPGDKTGEVTVHYPDGSSETVTVPVYVNSAADNNTPTAVKDPVKTNENTPLTDGQAKDAIANNSELPDGTTYTWSKQPDTTQPGDKTGEVTVHYPDGSSETVTVPVYVNSAADNNTPTAVKDPVKTNENTPLTDGQAKDAIANNSELPDGTTYTWSKQPDTTQPGDKTGEVTVHYPDGSSETVTVPVYVNSAADNNTPTAVKDPVKTNENTPLTDGQAKDAIANNSELPDGTTYTWSKQPDTTQPGDKTGEVTVHYPDGSSETVTVPVYVNSAADNNTPTAVKDPVKTNENTPLTDGQAKDAIANNSELPDGTTYTWSKQPDTTQPGDKTGEVTVHYPDGSSETVTVPVYVNSAADNNTPTAVKDPVKTNENTPLTDGQAKDAIANNSELPDGTTYTWSKQPDTTQPGDKTGEVTVHYPDGSSETVTVPVYVNSAADNNTPTAVKDPVKTNENTPLTDGQAKDAIANNSELPDGTTYTWSKQPDTTQPGDKTGEVTVHYPDGSSETVTVPVYVNSAADNNTPTAVKDPVKTNENTPLTDGQAKDAIANNSELPDGTTYTWSKQPDTTQPGDKTGEVTVHYPDGSSETVTVPVYVNSAADNNTPTAVKDPVKTNENTPLTDGQAKDAIANNSELPDGTTYTWSKQPDTTQPGDKTGEVTVHYPDGSSETVTVPVYVNSAADNNTPTAVKDPVKTNENTPLTDGQAKDAIANNSELPDGTTYTWSKQPDTTQPGDKTGEVTVHYPDGSSETVTVPVYVNSAADNNTPTAVKDPVKTNENTPLTDGQAKDAIANNSELPDGTTYTWSKQPDTTQPGDKTGEVTVHYPDGSSETVTVPVYVNSAADNNTPTAVKDPVKTNENTPLTDGQAKDAIANNSELPDGTTYTWSKQPDTTQPGDKTGEVTVHYPDGSSETVTVPVYVNSAADNNTPTAVKDPVKTNENTPLTDGQAKDAIANNSELPDGTTYTWSKQPDTTQPGDKTGEVTVHYPDGSSETVTVPVYVNSAADNNTPTAVKDPVKTNENTPLTDGQAKDAIANNSELPDGTTYTWSKQPDTTQPGDKTGEVTVHYPDGSSETVTVPVYVNSAADNNTPTAVKDPVKTNENTPLTDGQAKDAIANNSELPDGTTYTWSKQPDTTQPGDKTGEVTVHYPDGSSETVTVPVYVNSAADNNTPTAVKDPVKTNENTPLTDGQAKDAIANNSELPDGTTYTWSKQPDTTQPGDKTGEVTVHYPDGSSETVTVPVYVNSAADNNTPTAVKDPVKTNENTPLTDGQAKDAIANNSELPDGTTYTWSKQPDTTQPGDKTGEVTVHYPDGSSETVTVPVYVNSAADNNTPTAVKDPVKTNENTPLTDGQAKDAIANNSELPDGTTYTWSKQPDTTQPGDKTGEVTVHYPDGSSETVTVPVYVNSAADNNTPTAVKDPVKTNENTPLTDGQAKDAIANNSELPDGTTYTWSKQPDTTQPGDKTGEVTVHYPDGSSETVTVPVYVNSAADNNTPTAVKDPVKTNENTPLTDGQAKDAIANNSELPDGTTYTWSKQPDTTQPGDKTGEVTVHYPDGSSETVTVPVYVNSAADNNTPTAVKDPVKTNENTPLTDGQAKDAIANNSELPDGTTYTWSKQPDTTQPGDKTGEVTVHYPDGSSETVTVPVYVNSAADNNTPTAVKDPVKTNENTPLTDGQAKDAIANNSELPDGTTYTWSKQPDTTQPGDKTGEVTVHYPDGSSETVTVPVYVNSAADNNTPTAVKDPVKTNENTPLTDGQAKDAIANNSELPDGTTYTWSKQPDTTQPGDKTGEVTVHYPDGSSETVTVPVYVNSAADNNTPTAVKDPVKTNENTPLTDGQAKDAIANNSELPDGTTYTWSKQPDTTQPGDKTGEVTVHYPDGSSETVTVPVYVNSAADNNTPTAVKDPVKTNENTPLTDGQAKDAIANNSELPDGTTYTWSKQPDTTQPGDKTGEVTVHYPDGSSETVTVPVYVNSAADNNTPTAVKDPVKTNENTPLTDGQAKDAIANNSELPDGTTYTWSKQPDTTQPGDKTGEVTVHYPDGSSETVTVPVYVNSAADNNTPTAVKDPVKTNENTPLTDGQAKDAIANNSELPDGTTYTWSKQPDTTQPGDKTGEVTVHYPDGSSETVTVPVYVNSAADNNTPTAVKDPVKTNENTPLTDGQAKDAIANNSELPDGTTYTWSKQPDTTQPGDKTGEVTVHYPDGSSETVTVPVYVNSAADNNTPTAVKDPVKTNENTPLTDGQAKDAIANNSELPDGTTYTWSKQPDTTQPGDKTGEVTVHYPDGSSETVTVPVYVNSAADNNTPTAVKDPVKTNENTPLTDGQAKDAIANNSELPDGTTYTWSKQPDTTQPGDKTGEVTVHYPDGSSETVTVPVYVNSAADNNTPTAVKDPVKTNENTPLTDGQAKDAIANNSELPDGTTYTWSKQPDTTQPGDKTGEVTVHYPDGSSETVTVPVYVNSAADNNTPTAVKDPVKTNENTPLTDGQAKDAIANNSELPDGTTYTWSKQPDTTQPGDKTGEVTVHYPDGSSETVTVPVYVNSAADNNTPTVDQNAEVDPNSVVTNQDTLPKGTKYSWTTKPNTDKVGQPAKSQAKTLPQTGNEQGSLLAASGLGMLLLGLLGLGGKRKKED